MILIQRNGSMHCDNGRDYSNNVGDIRFSGTGKQMLLTMTRL